MTKLFIENREIELDETVQFAITKQFEELSDPTIIINDWSKTVSIPFTSKNNETFGHIYNPDKLIVTGSENDNYVGIYFDPTKKLDFRLEYDDTVLMTGYAKMTEIKQSKGRGSYEISLFGTLGKVLQEMSKITFDQTSPDENYIIDGAKYVSETYNKELIYNSWTSEGQTHSQLYPRKLQVPGGGTVNHPAYRITDIIGFVPNNSFDTEFDYKSQQVTDSSGNIIAQKFTTALENVHFEETTGISPDNVIPDGLMPREIGEYRSYLQLPFIYWNKLFQIFKEKTEEVTGYSVLLDDYWFNDDNPYWHDLVYMLQREKFDEKNTETKINNIYYPQGVFIRRADAQLCGNANKEWYSSIRYYYQGVYGYIKVADDCRSITNNNMIFPMITSQEATPLLVDDETLDVSLYNNYTMSFNCHFTASIITQKYDAAGFGKYNRGEMTGNNALILIFELQDNNNNVLTDVKYLVKCKNFSGTYNQSDFDYIIPFESIEHLDQVQWTDEFAHPEYGDCVREKINCNNFDIDFQMLLNINNYNKLHLNIKSQWFYRDNYPFNKGSYANEFYGGELIIRLDKPRQFIVNFEESNRSNSQFILNDLWNKDVKIFDEIIRYCKMFRLSIEVDNVNKTISFKSFNSIFDNYTIVDWTSKVDKSKDFNIKPVSLEEKYIIFNNESNKSDLSEKYKNDIGLEYGSYRLITNYEFNNNSKDLFKGCKVSITNTDFLLSWTNIHDNKLIKYSLPAEIYVYNKDKDKKFVSNFGEFYFHRGLKKFDTEASLALRPVIISDDTAYMQFNKSYFYEQYNQSENHISVTTYPYLDIIYDSNLCTFTAPKKSYTYNSEYSYKNGIYENLWADYINERYNIQNKLLTCYLMISPSDFVNFKWNQFIKIGNQIYIINKIYDYDIQESQSTKVDLIRVQDINAYTNVGFKYDYIRSSVNTLVVPYDHFRKIIIQATRNWEIEANDYTDFLAVTPTEGGPGITTVYIGAIDETNGYTLTFNLLDDLFNTIKTTDVRVTVGGTTSLEATPFLTQLNAGESGTFIVNSSSGWHLDWVDEKTGDNIIEISPTSWSSAGQKTVNITTSDFGNGTNDFYIENEEGDIVSKRVYVPVPYVSFSDPVIQLEQGQSTTIHVYNTASSPWQIESQTGNASVTISPTTGPGIVYPQLQTDTLVTITAGNTTGTNTYVFGTTGQPGVNTAKLIVIVQ